MRDRITGTQRYPEKEKRRDPERGEGEEEKETEAETERHSERQRDPQREKQMETERTQPSRKTSKTQKVPGGRCRSARAPQPPGARSWWEKVTGVARLRRPTAQPHQGAERGQRPAAPQDSGTRSTESGRQHKVPRLAVLPPHLQPRKSAPGAPREADSRVRRSPCPGTSPGCWALRRASCYRTLRRPPRHSGRPERTRPQTITRKRRGAKERQRPAVMAKDPAKRERQSTHRIQPLTPPGGAGRPR